MSTKDYCLSLKDKQNLIVDNNSTSNGQYSNLNLNNNQISSSSLSTSDKSFRKTNENKKVSNYDLTDNSNDSRMANSTESKKNLSSNLLNIVHQNSEKKGNDSKNSNTSNSSTLSLHIAAYENSVEAAAASKPPSTSLEKFGFKQILVDSKSAIQNCFEIPRQQKESDSKKPEIMQFKASQKLLNPNKSMQSDMGHNKRKRKPIKPATAAAAEGEGPSTDAKRIKENEEIQFLNELHQDAAKLLSDLLTDKKLVFVEGTVGCGKTTLVKRVAKELNLPIVTLQLSDQIDAKTFIGSYQCTEVPGEFVWEPSVFSKAVTKRCLILLEDIDSATTELVSTLYLMNKSWNAPLHSDGSLTAFHPDARIVATVRSENNHSDSSELIRSNPMTVSLNPLSNEELRKIIEHKFPSLLVVAEKLLNIFFELSQMMLADSIIDRDLNANDLIRACRRLSSLPNLNDNQQIFIELSDIYVLSISNISKRSRLAAALGKHLSISEQQVDMLLSKREPDVLSNTNGAKFGRAKIPVRKGILVDTLSTRHFGFTSDAKRLMERIAVCIQQNGQEAILLTGETGVGKTSVVQMMALYSNNILDVVNLSQDSDSTDLIGGYKPIGTLELLTPLIEDVDQLLKASFDTVKNSKFCSHFTTLLNEERFSEYLMLTEATSKKAIENKCGDQLAWADILVRCQRLSKSLNSRKSALPFAYVEGIVSKAAKNGHWLLVDEINLASSECLDAIIHVFDGNLERHPDFRLFACMNPATDTGKKKLPVGIRTRFTEFFVHEPTDREQLTVIVRNYLPTIEALHLGRLLNFYKEICQLFPRKYSLRNLCRALSFAGDNLYGNPYRSLFEGVSMSFGSDLDNDGMKKFDTILMKHFESVPFGIARAPKDGKKILVEGSYIEKGDNPPQTDPHYVYTESIKKNLSRLSRAVASGRFPILLEGETSAGKTSMILDLALTTGNTVHRINNHEHTDIQEYIGCYAPDENGKLTFVEGILLQAVRQGHWVILDELNLAPVEVLEALNRLLDDNRELFVAERNLVVKAHPRFRLFATQNPVGTYAGRKRLSRAFLNRFVVLRFDHPPFEELTQIVCARCGIANSPAIAMIQVLTELKRCRSNIGLFNASDGLMTLRDLFRWANRLAKSDSGEWRQVLADQGYFLLAARCRNSNDAAEVVRVLEKVLKVKIDTEKLFAIDSPYLPDLIGKQLSENIGHIVSTFGMRRMLVLSVEAWRCKEPILMVGETGCGKTTAAQLLSEGNLLSINCHERTETSDLLGTIRPKSDGSFFWQDGIVVQAMKNGSKLLIDEISLASDSVLERLNPLLESSRTVLLTDAGADAEVVVAHSDFQVVATMNPGTDHGKKELSKALRNRFTEIWCSCDHPIEDIKKIIAGRISALGHQIDEELLHVIDGIVEFFISFSEKYGNTFRTVFSIRDIIAAADLFLACKNIAEFTTHNSFVNSLTGVVVDSIGVLPARTTYNAAKLKKKCHQMILAIAEKHQLIPVVELEGPEKPGSLFFGNFPIELGSLPLEAVKHYSFSTPTTEQNALRVARALLLEKPIMLEGSPGAGKSSLIVALAKATGHSLVRLNLSDQTDLSDLFGHDVPISKPDGTISFQWQDGPILKAIKEGSWILLDEMNLASQSVLEGLNSCFDFRQELFIAELNKKFIINSDQCRFFACQNPQTQGGNRRALPKSFLNRFTSIYIEPFGAQDFSLILNQELPDSRLIVEKMIRFNREMSNLVKKECPGIEFEFNMRDLLRWASFIHEFHDISVGAEILYINRLPYSEVQQDAKQCFGHIFGADLLTQNSTIFLDESNGICFGQKKYCLPIKGMPALPLSNLLLLSSQSTLLQQLCICIKLNWIVLLNGPRLTGKSSVIETLSLLGQSNLKRMRLNKETDASELLGSYEQVLDYNIIEECFDEFCNILKSAAAIGLPKEHAQKVLKDLETTEKTDVHQLRCKIIQISALVKDEAEEKLNALANKLSKVYLRFEWRSSVFVEAYKNGDWLLIEDVNCCSAAVLDRLNCCLESGGKLVLPEQIDGSIEEIEPHPSFRIFFTMDSKNGALSRAMKNRCVEFCIDEKSSWFGNVDSALNVMLLKEPRMCSTISDGEWKNEMNMECLKKFLRASARTNLSTEERLTEFSDAFDLLPSMEDELKTDKVSFHALTAAENFHQRNPPLLLSSKRQLRLPFAEHPLFKHRNGIVPDVLHSELQIQEFYRIAMDWESEEGGSENVLPSEYELANLVLAIMASSSDCLMQNSIFYNTFKAVDEGSKKEMITVIVDILKRQRISKSSTPWDLRVYENSTFDYVSDETIDKRLLKFLAIWLKHETQLMKSRMGNESPFALSSAFQEGEIDSSKLQNSAYATLSFICQNLISAAEHLELSNSSGDELRDNLNRAFEYIFGLAVFMDISVTSRDTVHPLLLIRQCLQDLGISFYATKEHPIWKQIYAFFKANKRYAAVMDKFTNIIGTSSVSQTIEYIDSLNAVCAVRPLGDEMDYLSLKNLIPSVQENYVTTKHRSQPSRFSLDSLVYGLQNLLKTYVFIKHKNIGENFVLHFPESALQHFEILNRFSHEESSTKEMLKFLTVLNSNVATYNINPSLKTAHVTSVEILLDVIIDFWKGFRFSTTSFAAIPLNALASASDKISEYQSFIWIARNIIQKYSTLLSKQILSQTSNFMDGIKDNFEFFNRCKDAFKMIIPAKGLVDPGLIDLVNLSVNQSRQKVLELFAICSKLFPAQASAHPILRFIHENIVRTAETIECLEQKQIKVYRTSHLKFDEFNTELRQFYSRWLSALDGYIVRQGPWYRNVTFSTVLGHSSRTNTLINLAQSFCERLLFEYYDLPDVILPVYALLQCFLLIFYLQSYLCERHLKLRRINTECNNIIDDSTFVYPSTEMFENESALRQLALEGRESVMPMQFQLEVAQSLLTKKGAEKSEWNEKAELAFGWVMKEWGLWFEKHKEKREQMFVYKSTGGGKTDEDDETMPDPEDIEIQALLPNFDDTDFEAAASSNASSSTVQSRLPDAKDLCAIVDVIIGNATKGDSDTLLSSVWLLDFFNHSDALLNPNFDPNSTPSQFVEHSILMDKHLLAISKFRQSLLSKPLKNVINVYTENDKAEVNRCVDAIRRLEARVNEIRDEFPEEANLKEISEIITTFLNADCGVPQMKLASWIEKVLEKCEHWQKLAPRQYSLIDQLNELQQILVDWRKMQVHSWHHIINAVQEESQAIAVTMGYPIIETLMQWRQNPGQEKNIKNFLAMIVDWIQCSTLIDFESRLKIASFAACLIEIFAKSDTQLYELSPAIKSIVFYFSAYLQCVQEKLKKKRAEVVQELENFVNIVKFHDLNLWSVKNSAEKAHQKLFKIIKRYKLHGNEQLSTLFLSHLPEIPRPSAIEILKKSSEVVPVESKLNFANFYERFSKLLMALPGLNEPESLFEYCSDYLGILKKDVIYAENDDEGNEKLQGQALFDRQRRFAALVKLASKFGLRSRRAAPISSEELLASSLTMDAKNTGLNEEYFRACAVTRNLVIRLVNQLNATKQPHILKQVSVQMISHIRGITEYGFAWLLNAAPTFQRFDETIQWIRTTKNRLSIFVENAKRPNPCFSGSQKSQAIFDEAKHCIKKSFEIGKLLQSLIAAAPEKSINSTFNSDTSILAELRDVALHKEHSKYFEIKTKIDDLVSTLQKMSSLSDDYGKRPIEDTWKLSDTESFLAILLQEVNEALKITNDKDLEQHFAANLNNLSLYLKDLHQLASSQNRFEAPLLGDVAYISSEIYQFKMQQTFKAVDSKIDETQAPLDIFKKIAIACSAGIDFNQEITRLVVLMDQLSHGYSAPLPDLERYTKLTTEILETLELVQSALVQFTDWVAVFYIHFGHVSSQILQKGLVNAIPKKEEGEGGQGKDMEDVGGENAGMGEGQGAKDVSEQIEETGQVDDLMNEDEENGTNENQEPQEKPKDSENPLEMEEDFAADLENLDNEENEKGDNDNDNDEPDEEPNIDWDMGDVEEPEENQLDPNLWDKPEQEDKKLDDKAEGADKQTEEIAAKENDDTVANEDNNDKEDGENDEKNDETKEDKEEKEDDFDLENVNQNDVTDNNEEEEEAQPPPQENELDSNQPIDGEGEDATDDEADAETEEQQQPDTDMEVDENEEDATTEEPEKEAEIAEDGVQSEEVEKNNQGQTASDEKTKQNSRGGEKDDEKENAEDEEKDDENLEAKEETTQGKNDAKNARARASLQKAQKPIEEASDDVEVNEPESSRRHAQPTEEDEEMDVDRADKEVDEAMDDDELDEASKNLAHINDDKHDSRDQLVVQKSTVEEARSTRSQYEHMKPNYENDIVESGQQDDDENERLNQKDEEDFTLTSDELKHTVLHISKDFFDLSQQAVKSLANIQPDIDSAEASTNDARKYASLSDSVGLMASELAENLRQILEPSIANRLQGDYRTGKRLNMRRLVSYIASDYRKNRIWLRRTKKQQRNFQIMIAIDDSQSMGENRMNEITCQSVCLIEKAFRQLEVGQLALCKFGQTVQMLREFSSATDAQDTLIPSLLDNLQFDQNKTDLLGLLSYAAKTFETAKENTPSSSVPVQMLVVIGDGHGAFAQGRDPLVSALKEMEHQAITVLYIIVDGKNSILKMNYTTFENGKPKMTPYISEFPFSFYALVRSISTLPGTLAEAIRQWFEMAMQE